MTSLHNIANTSIASHAFNGDGTQMAASLRTSSLYIFRVPTDQSQKFQLLDIVKGHNTDITVVDWAPKADRIVSCSIDRNIFVWFRDTDGKWKPAPVSLALNLPCISVKWSPQEEYFAAGSSSKAVLVSSFNKEMNWWVGKVIKKHFKSTVTCLDWHPNDPVIACGSSDFRMRVFSLAANSQSAWGSNSTWGKLLFDYYENEGGWVLCVAFSHDGNRLVWMKQSSVIFVADVAPPASNATNGVRVGPALVTHLRTEFQPFTTCLWVGTNTFVAAGYDCFPVAFRYTENGIEYVQRLDLASESKTTNKLSAMRKFQEIDRMATTDTGSRMTTLHQNCINDMRIYKGTNGNVTCFSTVGRDGALVFWDLPSLCQKISQLSIS